ncbi:hypothetical protein AVEN_111466-1 [Araneus ventricosus]|uniref:Uncharacterized protein n=1 Tax=Araneus ventricosus TaxID=182803 RepID=A0A4Y2K2M4_ARAVE|nr:hypothetical protein AVEN_111466-1 [Araneus ventricosus]
MALFLKAFPLRGSPSIGEYRCPNPEVPRDLDSLPVYPPLCLLLSAAYFHPSTASEGALHEKLLPLCLLPASDGQPKTPRVGRAWRPFRRVVHCWSPVYQFGWYPNRLHHDKRRGWECPEPVAAIPRWAPWWVVPSAPDAEMSSSSASEGDTLEYDMSEDLEDTPQNVCPIPPPPPSTARKR